MPQPQLRIHMPTPGTEVEDMPTKMQAILARMKAFAPEAAEGAN